MIKFPAVLSFIALVALTACEPPTDIVYSQKGALELRAMQSRVYPTANRNATLRSVIGTLQDIGYNIDSVEASTGTVTATKLAALRVSASIYPHGSDQTVVRANAIVMVAQQGHQVDDPTFYQQDFFDPLSRTLALAAADAPVDDASVAPALKNITPDSIKPAEQATKDAPK